MQNTARRESSVLPLMANRRIRVFLRTIHHNADAAAALDRLMASSDGVLYTKANPLTGNVLVVYDEEVTDAYALGRRLYQFDKNSAVGHKSNIIEFDNLRRLKTPQSQNPAQDSSEEADIGGEAPFYTMGKQDLEHALDTDTSLGLTERQAQELQKNYGLNILSEKKCKSLIARFFGNLFDFSNRLLLGVGLISLAVGRLPDAIAIFGIVLIQTVLSTIQSHKAENSIASLNRMLVNKARVLRDGQERVIASKYLVPGDVIVVEGGDKIPADARIVEMTELRTTEASLTGESAAVEKNTRPCRINTEIAGRHNMLFMGSDVLCGRAKAVVTVTGMRTELGRIAAMLQDIQESIPPIQQKVRKLTKAIAIAAGCASLLFTGFGLMAGRPLGEVLVLSICFSIGAIPESLPAVVSASMALSVQRMAKKNAIVRSLPAVETLGSTDVICCDKTGTLTMNEMTVRRIYTDGCFYAVTGTGYGPSGIISPEEGCAASDQALHELLRAGVLCNNARIARADGKWTVQGDPTEGALLAAAAKYGLDIESIGNDCRRLREIPFDSARQCMITHTSMDGGDTAYCKGAFNKVSEKCGFILRDGVERPMTHEDRAEIQKICDDMGSAALRVLTFSYKRLAAGGNLESDFVFLGLMGMSDPMRPAARDAVARCRKAGVRVVMITGDNRNTAAEVARQVGLLTDGRIIAGADIDAMTDNELADQIDQVQVFARTCPQQKHRIVMALKQAGHTVAMVGDGVNDAPAMKEADIGIAMGMSGSDVARDVAGITLVDDDLAIIVDAIQEGRAVTESIETSIKYLLTGALGEVAAIALCSLGFGVLPLLSIQILWINVITETIIGSVLASGPPSPEVMDRPPLDKDGRLLNKGMLRQVLTGGMLTALMTTGVFSGAMLLGRGLATARTLAFSTLITSQLACAHRCRRTADKPPGPYLPLATLSSAALLAGIVYLKPLQSFFGTVPLSLPEAGAALTAGGAVGELLLNRQHDPLQHLV